MMTFEEFKRKTKINFASRGENMSLVDTAFQAYENQKNTATARKALLHLKETINNWINLKNAKGKTSTNNANRKAVIDKLLIEVEAEIAKLSGNSGTLASIIISNKMKQTDINANESAPKLTNTGVFNQKDSTGRYITYLKQAEENSCGPCCVKIISKRAINMDISEQYLKEIVEELEAGRKPTFKGGAISTTGTHDWSLTGKGTWLVPNVLGHLKINGKVDSSPNLLINGTTYEKPGVGVVQWLAGGLHYVVVAGQIVAKDKLQLYDPYYGAQTVDVIGGKLSQYKPEDEHGNTLATADWYNWVWLPEM